MFGTRKSSGLSSLHVIDHPLQDNIPPALTTVDFRRPELGMHHDNYAIFEDVIADGREKCALS